MKRSGYCLVLLFFALMCVFFTTVTICTDQGPDQIVPTDNLFTWYPSGVVKLKYWESSRNETGAGDYISIPTMMKLTATEHGEKIAIKYKTKSGIEEVTYKEYEQICRTVAKAFLKLGLERQHAVGILGCNAPQWIYSALGSILAGGFQAGIYPTNSPDACLHCLTLSSANIVVVEDDEQLQKILAVKNKLNNLKAIIQYTGQPQTESVYSWDDVIRMGQNELDEKLENILKNISINECCTIVYTSGTTALPKAVMLSHDNIIFGAKQVGKTYFSVGHNHVTMSYLPMSHIASQIFDIFVSWLYASTLCIADKNSLKNTLIENLKFWRPTSIIGVPRIWEKLKIELITNEENDFTLHKLIMKIAKEVSLSYYKNLTNTYTSWLYEYYRHSIFNKIKNSVGMDRCNIWITGGAPTLPETIEYFYSMDMPIIQGYGMSETSALCTIGSMKYLLSNYTGKVIPEMTDIKISHPDQNGQGEFLMYGRSVFMGYLNDKHQTLETFERDGWMRSGDFGTIDTDGNLKLIGRLKEIVITEGGENIPAPLIESNLKKELPVISNALVIGDNRKYLTILLTLKSICDPISGVPSDLVTDVTKKWCISIGYNCSTISNIISERPEQVYKAIQEGIDRANAKAISKAQKIQKFAILPRDFSVVTEELGPTLKLKRSYICTKYSAIIEDMYENR